MSISITLFLLSDLPKRQNLVHLSSSHDNRDLDFFYPMISPPLRLLFQDLRLLGFSKISLFQRVISPLSHLHAPVAPPGKISSSISPCQKLVSSMSSNLSSKLLNLWSVQVGLLESNIVYKVLA